MVPYGGWVGRRLGTIATSTSVSHVVLSSSPPHAHPAWVPVRGACVVTRGYDSSFGPFLYQRHRPGANRRIPRRRCRCRCRRRRSRAGPPPGTTTKMTSFWIIFSRLKWSIRAARDLYRHPIPRAPWDMHAWYSHTCLVLPCMLGTLAQCYQCPCSLSDAECVLVSPVLCPICGNKAARPGRVAGARAAAAAATPCQDVVAAAPGVVARSLQPGQPRPEPLAVPGQPGGQAEGAMTSTSFLDHIYFKLLSTTHCGMCMWYALLGALRSARANWMLTGALRSDVTTDPRGSAPGLGPPVRIGAQPEPGRRHRARQARAPTRGPQPARVR